MVGVDGAGAVVGVATGVGAEAEFAVLVGVAGLAAAVGALGAAAFGAAGFFTAGFFAAAGLAAAFTAGLAAGCLLYTSDAADE